MPDALHYSPQAQLDLDEILDYFAFEREDATQGARIVENILAATERLPGRATRYPLVGPLPFIDDVYRFMTVGSHLVFFRVQGEDIFVDRVLYRHRDFASLLGRA